MLRDGDPLRLTDGRAGWGGEPGLFEDLVGNEADEGEGDEGGGPGLGAGKSECWEGGDTVVGDEGAPDEMAGGRVAENRQPVDRIPGPRVKVTGGERREEGASLAILGELLDPVREGDPPVRGRGLEPLEK